MIQIVSLDLAFTHEVCNVSLPGDTEFTSRRMVVIEHLDHRLFDIQRHCDSESSSTVQTLKAKRHTTTTTEKIDHVSRLVESRHIPLWIYIGMLHRRDHCFNTFFVSRGLSSSVEPHPILSKGIATHILAI
ncbi:hypothetical protein AKJ12_10575 [Xanthomonas arboricola pv. juglandis]|nr:hypothetical protein AKJ12_10575 [Xanthomonas arboricola pv. juglandis]KOB27405.1 hypothetical protein AE927_09765 [Xanthomonas arboricola]KOB51027.1 hypothetical protein AE932_03945 [Xanthomonas arboricola]